MKQKIYKLCSILLVLAMVLSVFVTATTVAAATIDYKDYVVNRGTGLKNTYAKLKAGEEVNVFYFGGSITVGYDALNKETSSWRGLTGKWLRDNFPQANVINHNVAYGNTGSWFGLYRMVEEIFPKNPDLIFIEFSMNDFYDQVSEKDATLQFETIIHTVREKFPECDIVNVLTTEKSKILNLMSDGMLHTQAKAHEAVAEVYDVPTLRVGHALADYLYAEAGYNWQDIWSQYATDIVHLTDKGYRVYQNVVDEYLKSQLKSGIHDGQIKKHTLPDNIVSDGELRDGDMAFINADNDFNNVAFELGSKNTSYVSTSYSSGVFKDSVKVSALAGSKLVMEFTGTELSACYSAASDFSGFILTVDGDFAYAIGHKNVAVLLKDLEYGKHTVTIKPSFSGGNSGEVTFYGFFTRNQNKATHKHIYDNDCDKSCNVCGKTRTVPGHVYDNACDDVCNKCRQRRTVPNHKYGAGKVTKATTSKNGKIVNKCTVCGKVASTTTIKYAKSFKLSTTEYTYNGKAKKPIVTVKDSAGKNLVKNTDYTVDYKNNKKVGKATVTIKLKGKYKGTKTLSFKINPKESKVEKLTAGKKSLKVKLKKVTSQAKGYEIQYSTSKTFKSKYTKTKKVTSYKTTSVTLKSLKAKKTYYVRVRTYKTVDGKKYYSDWSSKKSKKTK